jgi:phage shock protein A
MGLMKQLRQITAARLRAASESGDIREIAGRIAKELDEHLAMAAGAEAKALASSLTWQRRLDEIHGKIARLARGAELAVSQNDEDTAREALFEQLKAENEAEQLQKTLRQSEQALEDARATRKELEEQARDIRSRIPSWQQISEQQRLERIAGKERTTIPAKAEDVMAEASRIEQRLEETESELTVRRRHEDRSGLPLDIRLRELERQAEVDRRMKELGKSKSAGRKG